MTLSEQAAKAIKDATGWEEEFFPLLDSAAATSPNGAHITVWLSKPGLWTCAIDCIRVLSSQGEGPTPEAAIAAVLPRYRAHIAALAADILPGWPRLEWRAFYGSHRLVFVAGKLEHPILTVDPENWLLSIYTRPGHADVYPQRTREAVLAAVVAHVESLGLPCVLPDFPGASDA